MTSHFIYGPYTFEASAMDRSDGSNLAPAYRRPPLPASRGCPRLTPQSVDRLRLLVGGKRRDQGGGGGTAGRGPAATPSAVSRSVAPAGRREAPRSGRRRRHR